MWGESQGGHAALWTAIEARGYARELNLVATAAAAPPTDLPENLRQSSDQNARAFLSALLAYSWAKRFDAPLDKLFGPLNRGVANQLAQKCISLKSTPNLGTLLGILSIRNALKDKDMGSTQGWSRLARRNSVRAADVPGPVLIAQSVADPLVALAVTRSFAQDLCRKRRAVRWVSLPGGDHAHSARDSAGPTLAWIADRFSGRRAPSDCGRF
ncbi:lipase family protein [Leptolyngbya sp. 15MV]|nr:lipase family protein [Leptolyngbya sp. 15MV]